MFKKINLKIKKAAEKIFSINYNKENDHDINKDLKNTMDLKKGELEKILSSYKNEERFTVDENQNSDPYFNKRIKQAFKEILDLSDKNRDKQSSNDTSNPKTLLNYHVYINIITKAYNNGIKDKKVKHDDAEAEDLRNTVRFLFDGFKKRGDIKMIVGSFVDKFQEDLELNLGFSLKWKGNTNNERFTNLDNEYDYDYGVTKDKSGRILEHQRGRIIGCYLITALTKSRLLSIGQVYQLRKLMLEAFKVKSNRPFFSFYYDNFGPVADMLVKHK